MDFTLTPASAFVQADSQQPNPQANGLFVAQAAAPLLAWAVPVGPVTSGAITALSGSQTITLSRVSGVTNNVTWQLAVGQTLVLEPNTPNQEAAVITAVFPTTNQVQVVVKNNHTPAGGSAGVTAVCFFLDQSRSAMSPDGVAPQGSALVTLAAVDPVTGNRFSAKAATVDGLNAANATIVSQGLINAFGTMERQRTDGGGRLATSDQELLGQILVELRTMNLMLAEGLGTSSDPDDYRSQVVNDFPTN